MALIKPEQLRSGSYEISGSFSGSFQGDGSGLNNITASLAPNYVLTSSYIQDSSSFDTRILNNSSSIDTLSGSFIGFSGSYITDSASFDTRISNNSSSIDLLSGSFDSFTQTYNTGSFTGSFIGDGSQLTGIVSSKWSGSNPITRDSDVEITGSLNVSGSIDVTNIVNAFILSGSLRTDKISFTEQGTFTGVQGDLGYSFSDGKFTFYIENDVPIELGQTLYARVRNADSVVLTKGTIVDFTTDTVGQTPRVKRAIATSGSDCSCFVGIVLQNIGLNQFGAIMLNGVARGLNLTSFNTDDQLYLSSTISGSATTTIPTPPVKAIRIGKVLNASTSPTQGVLYVRPENRTVYFDLDQFKQTYNTGSFTGSFIGDGSQLTGIVSSKWSGSNPISRDSDVEITGSLVVSNGITGSLFGIASTASYVDPLFLSSSISSSGFGRFVPNETIGFRTYTDDIFITDGFKGYRPIGFDSRIIKIRAIANVTGSIDVNIIRNNTIIGSIVLFNQSSLLDTTLSGWTTILNTDDLLEFYISGSSTYITDISIFINIEKL
jgi:hypothetical protein